MSAVHQVFGTIPVFQVVLRIVPGKLVTKTMVNAHGGAQQEGMETFV